MLGNPGGGMEASVVALVSVVFLIVLFAAARWWAGRIENKDIDPVDKVHKLRRAISTLMAVGFVGAIVLAPAGVDGLVGESRSEAAGFFARMGSVVIGGLVAASVAYAGGFPAYRRARGLKTSTRSSLTRMVRAMTLGFAPPLLWFGILFLVPDDLILNPFARFGFFTLFIIGMAMVAPFFIRAAQKTKALDADIRERLLAFFRSQGLRVRDVRAIEAREERVANAVIAGLLPVSRTVFITDTLLDELDEEELKAVLAHEIAHGKQHHVAIQVGATIALVGAISGVGALVATMGSAEGILVIFLVAAPFAVFLAIALVRAKLGRRLEEKADDYAGEVVGTGPMIRALEKITEINMMKRRRGRIARLFEHHPDVEGRVARLRRREGIDPDVGRDRAA